MELITLFIYILLFVAILFFSYLNLKYFFTIWHYKNRKKDGSEDKEFKMFD